MHPVGAVLPTARRPCVSLEFKVDPSVNPSTTHSRSRTPLNLRNANFPRLGALVVLLTAAVVLRIAAMIWVPLIPEEAYYWMYSQHAELSYYDHPPMVAWVIKSGTTLFGNTEFGVRSVGHMLMLASSVVIYRIGRTWFGRTEGLLAALALQILPLYFCTGFIATMDSPLVFFWLVCMLGVTHALKNNSPVGWYVAGFGLGGAMLSKYTGVALGGGALAMVVLHRPWRRHLWSVHPYLAVLLAGAMFSPVVIWNAHHDWASFRFQFIDRFEGHTLNLRDPAVFIFFQLLVLTPVVFALLLLLPGYLARRLRRIMVPRWLFSLAFSLPMLLVMVQKSFHSEVHINWTLPLFLSLLPALARLSRVRLRQARRRLAFRPAAPLLWTANICLVINILTGFYLLFVQPRTGWLQAFGPWRELAAMVETLEDEVAATTGQEPLIIAEGKYRLASVLAFYRTPLESDSRASDYTSSEWMISGEGLGYEYWMSRKDWVGRTCVVVYDDPLARPDRRGFPSLKLINVRSISFGHRQYSAAICIDPLRDLASTQ